MHSLEALVPLPGSHLRALDDAWWIGGRWGCGSVAKNRGLEDSTELSWSQ